MTEIKSTQKLGRFIVVEGPPYCGKLEICQLIVLALNKQGEKQDACKFYNCPNNQNYLPALRRCLKKPAEFLNIIMLDLLQSFVDIVHETYEGKDCVMFNWIPYIEAHRAFGGTNFSDAFFNFIRGYSPVPDYKFRITNSFDKIKKKLKRGHVLEKLSSQAEVHSFYNSYKEPDWILLHMNEGMEKVMRKIFETLYSEEKPDYIAKLITKITNLIALYDTQGYNMALPAMELFNLKPSIFDAEKSKKRKKIPEMTEDSLIPEDAIEKEDITDWEEVKPKKEKRKKKKKEKKEKKKSSSPETLPD